MPAAGLPRLDSAMQAVKRLMTFMQRAHPTDPSRCVDFGAYRNPGRGAAGSGSEKASRLLGKTKASSKGLYACSTTGSGLRVV